MRCAGRRGGGEALAPCELILRYHAPADLIFPSISSGLHQCSQSVPTFHLVITHFNLNEHHDLI